MYRAVAMRRTAPSRRSPTGARAVRRRRGVAGTYIWDWKPPCIPPTGLAVGLTAGEHANGRVSAGRYGRISGRFAPSGSRFSAIRQWVPRSPPSTEATRRVEQLFGRIGGSIGVLCDDRHTSAPRIAEPPGIRPFAGDFFRNVLPRDPVATLEAAGDVITIPPPEKGDVPDLLENVAHEPGTDRADSTASHSE